MIHGPINMLKGREDCTEPCTELSVLLDLIEFSSQLGSGASPNYARSKLGWETPKNMPELKEMGWGPCFLFFCITLSCNWRHYVVVLESLEIITACSWLWQLLRIFGCWERSKSVGCKQHVGSCCGGCVWPEQKETVWAAGQMFDSISYSNQLLRQNCIRKRGLEVSG